MSKGKTNNPNGRPKGKPNKISTDLKAFITEIIEQNRETIKSDLQALEPYQRLVIIDRMMRFVIAPEQPKQTPDPKPYIPMPIICFGDD